MRTVRAGWQAVVAAFLGGLWAVASLAGEGLLLGVLMGVLVVVAVLPLRRWPIVAGPRSFLVLLWYGCGIGVGLNVSLPTLERVLERVSPR